MTMDQYLTPKRKSILLNGLFFGGMAALGALPALISGQPISLLQTGLLLVAAFAGGFVGYFNANKAEFETGARATDGKFKAKAPAKTKIGL